MVHAACRYPVSYMYHVWHCIQYRSGSTTPDHTVQENRKFSMEISKKLENIISVDGGRVAHARQLLPLLRHGS